MNESGSEREPLPRWLAWAREIQALAQTGLAFSNTGYEVKRYQRLAAVAAEMVSACADLDREAVLRAFLEQPGYATPKIDVRGAVVREGKLLLVQERTDERWCMPGGWADVGDRPSDMAAREVLEESGLRVKPEKVIGVYDANREGRPLSFFHAYKIVFLCTLLEGEPRPSDETLDARFFPFDALPELSSPRTTLRHVREVQAHLEDPARPAAFD